MNHKIVLYGVIAGGTAILTAKQPGTAWEWTLLGVTVCVQIANALKALYSAPPPDDQPPIP